MCQRSPNIYVTSSPNLPGSSSKITFFIERQVPDCSTCPLLPPWTRLSLAATPGEAITGLSALQFTLRSLSLCTSRWICSFSPAGSPVPPPTPPCAKRQSTWLKTNKFLLVHHLVKKITLKDKKERACLLGEQKWVWRKIYFELNVFSKYQRVSVVWLFYIKLLLRSFWEFLKALPAWKMCINRKTKNDEVVDSGKKKLSACLSIILNNSGMGVGALYSTARGAKVM